MHHIVRSGLVFTSEAAAKAPIHSDSGLAFMPPSCGFKMKYPSPALFSYVLFLVPCLTVNTPDIKSSIQYLEDVDSNSLRTPFRCEIVAGRWPERVSDVCLGVPVSLGIGQLRNHGQNGRLVHWLLRRHVEMGVDVYLLQAVLYTISDPSGGGLRYLGLPD